MILLAIFLYLKNIAIKGGMIMQSLKKIGVTSILLCFLILLFTPMLTNASVITVDPLNSDQGLGSDFVLTIKGTGFTEGAGGTSGGGLNVSWNPAFLSVDDLSDVNITFTGDLFFTTTPVLDTGAGTLEFSTSSINGETAAGFDIAEITFTAIGLGLSPIDITVDSLIDVWADYDSLAITTPSATDGSVNVVPIPGAIWLLGSGLIGMVGIRRKLGKS